MENAQKPARIGKKMAAALAEIRLRPGVTDIVINRQFGANVSDSLIRAGLVDSNGNHAVGRKLFAVTQELTNVVPLEDHVLRGPLPGESIADLNRHNTLAIICPACNSAAGKQCLSLKTGRPVQFPHHDRQALAMQTLAVLLFLKV